MLQTATETRVLFIQYDDNGRPFSVCAINKKCWCIYDFDWSEKDGELYWHKSGDGGDRSVELGQRVDGTLIRYWAHPSVVVEDPQNGRRLKRPLRQFPPTKLFDFPESETEWCSICKSRVSTEPWRPCPHIWWCNEMGWWSTPGERCGASNKTCQSEHQ